MSFAAPECLLLLLLPLAAAAATLVRHRWRIRQQRSLASPGVWARVMGGTPATGLLRLLAWCGAAALLVVALARPQWGELPGLEEVTTRDLVLAVDVSDSMRCPDVEPTRLERSLDTVRRALPRLEGNRVGVVVFAGEAYPLVPLTLDLSAVAAFLDTVEPGMVARPGSDISTAVRASLELLPSTGDGRVVVLATDGENLQGDLDAAVAALDEGGVSFLAMLAGTAEGGPILLPQPGGEVRYKRDRSGQPVVTRARPEVLADIADDLDGEVVDLLGADPPAELAEAVGRLRTRQVESTRTVRRVERFPLFLAGAAVLLAMGFLLSPWRRLATVVLLLLAAAPMPAGAQQAPAEEPPVRSVEVPWWQRVIPGGSRRMARAGAEAFDRGDLVRAVERLAGAAALDPDDPVRVYDLGTALAAAGETSPALVLLDRADAADVAGATFNAGTAALTAGQAEQAVERLRKVVVEDPDDADAKRNYELALRMLQQQQDQDRDQEQEQKSQEDEEKEQEQEPDQSPPAEQDQPTPTPRPGSQGAPTPTPTPSSSEAIYGALERAEAEAREAMRTPTPVTSSVEKDW